MGLILFVTGAHGQEHPSIDQISTALKQLSPHVAAEVDHEQLRTMLGRRLRQQLEAHEGLTNPRFERTNRQAYSTGSKSRM
jgi:hypothetical protein